MSNSTESEKILKHHGKTFYFAQRFLGKKSGHGVARLYSFCRFIDDLADESEDKHQAKSRLKEILHQLDNKQAKEPVVEDFLDLAAQWQINLRYAKDLIQGVIMDLDVVAISGKAELLQYCYRVAGTVGLMMCPLLRADHRGEPFALDLGIGMQLTNIARDVLHDAGLGRRYLPADMVGNLTAEDICELRVRDRDVLQRSIEEILELADTYYQSAAKGFVYLPIRSRISIAIAARTYRQIGIKLMRNGCNFWQGRTYTTLFEKLYLAVAEIFTTLAKALFLPQSDHDNALHTEISTLLVQQTKGEKNVS